MDLDAALEQLRCQPGAPLDLAEIALLLARDEYPRLDVEASLAELSAWAREAAGLVRGTPRRRAEGLSRLLFHELGFRGNADDYYDPANSYLNVVMERRTGIPISLAGVMLAVGARAGLALFGVGLPGHFIVKLVEAGEEVLIDPFHGGRLLTPTDCTNLVRHATGLEYEVSPQALEAVPLGFIVRRMLNNLRGIYLSRQDWNRAVRILGRLRQLDPRDVVLRRDLGLCLLQLGRPGPAVEHLHAYLTDAAEADDVEAVTRFLGMARRGAAEMN